MNQTGSSQPEALDYLERLVELARQKNIVLKERKHAELPAIVAAEEEVLAELEQLRQRRNGPPSEEGVGAFMNSVRPPQMLAQVAAAVAELQRLNSTNSAMLQEHLAGVSMCLELLNTTSAPTYSPGGVSSEDRVLRRVLDVRG